MPKYKLIHKDKVHVFDSDNYLLNGEKIQGKEYALLKVFVSAKGYYIPKDNLIEKLWNDDINTGNHDIGPYLTFLRKRFGEDKIIICEKRKDGNQSAYKFDCAIKEINESTTNFFSPYKNSTVNDVDSETEYIIREKDYKDFV